MLSRVATKINHGISRTVSQRSFLTFIATSDTGIKQTFGKAGGIWNDQITLEPGLHVYLPIVQDINVISNRLKQKEIQFEVKTKDNVFTQLKLSVQWYVKQENTANAFFLMDSPDSQIESYIENIVRSRATKSTIDELFTVQYEIAQDVRKILEDVMDEYGYTITDTLITDIEPDEGVKKSMNEINRTERLKIASQNEADAYYIRSVREAEADARRKELQGEGISKQRQAIMQGYEESVGTISQKLGLRPQEILGFMERMQGRENHREILQSDNNKVVFLPEEQKTIQEFVASHESRNT